MDSFSDDCLTQLDLSFPAGDLSESLPRNDDHLLDSAMAEEQQSQAFLELPREEEEAGHLVRLESLLYGFEADRPVIAKWLRSIRRSAPTASLH